MLYSGPEVPYTVQVQAYTEIGGGDIQETVVFTQEGSKTSKYHTLTRGNFILNITFDNIYPINQHSNSVYELDTL